MSYEDSSDDCNSVLEESSELTLDGNSYCESLSSVSSEGSSDSHAWREGERYNDKQEQLLEDLEEAVRNSNVDWARRLIQGIESSRLEEYEESLKEKLLENFDDEMFDLFSKFEELCFSKSELNQLLDTALSKDQNDIVRKMIEVLQPDQDDLINDIFNAECEYSCSSILHYCLDQYSSQIGYEQEIQKISTLVHGGDRKLSIRQAITSLLYESQRHAWDSFPCLIRRELIKQLDSKSKFDDYSKSDFENYIQNKEKSKKDFYGVDLSDDSDSEDERSLLRENAATRLKKLADAKALAKKAQIDKLKPSSRSGANTLIGRANPQYDLNDRVKLKKPAQIQIENDLETLNDEFSAAVKSGNEKALLDSLPTKFVVMQVRGVTYSTSRWNTPGRRFHRELNEVDQPLFADAVYRAAELNFNSLNGQEKFNDIHTQDQLAAHADRIKRFLLDLRQLRNVSHDNKTYLSAADLIQSVYTNDYDAYPNLLTQMGFDGKGNPFVSTSDRPYHALRYAYGIKPYKGHEKERLRPRWQNNGRAERNKSGKVYLSIHPLSDYGKHGPLSVTEMVWQGHMFADNQIIAERETTFPAYLPADRVKHQFIAKYPSFHRPYKNIYQIKYGFDKELYELFQDAIKNTSPHTPEHKAVKKLLGDWLCVFNEVKLVEQAQAYARENNLVLVYRQPDGTFKYSLSVDSPYRNGQSAEVRDAAKQKRAERESSPAIHQSVKSIQRAVSNTKQTIDELGQMCENLALEDEEPKVIAPKAKKNLLATFNLFAPKKPAPEAPLPDAPNASSKLPAKK